MFSRGQYIYSADTSPLLLNI